MSNHKIAPAIDLMTQYLEEGYDAEHINYLPKRVLAKLIVCPLLVSMVPEDDKYHSAHWHHDQIIRLAKEALLALVLEEIANSKHPTSQDENVKF